MLIEDMRADYHRNGVGGEGSHVAMFRVSSPDIGQRIPFMAVLWGCDDAGDPTECHVMRLTDLAEPMAVYLESGTPEGLGSRQYPAHMDAWRSTDHFLPHLLEPLREAMRHRGAVFNATVEGWKEAEPSKTP